MADPHSLQPHPDLTWGLVFMLPTGMHRARQRQQWTRCWMRSSRQVWSEAWTPPCWMPTCWTASCPPPALLPWLLTEQCMVLGSTQLVGSPCWRRHAGLHLLTAHAALHCLWRLCSEQGMVHAQLLWCGVRTSEGQCAGPRGAHLFCCHRRCATSSSPRCVDGTTAGAALDLLLGFWLLLQLVP
jgi:hypothetical protein